VGYVVASNHFHILAWAEDAQRLAKFVGYFNSNLAREVSRKTGWTGKIWDRRRTIWAHGTSSPRLKCGYDPYTDAWTDWRQRPGAAATWETYRKRSLLPILKG
jgi:hypothetical protein